MTRNEVIMICLQDVIAGLENELECTLGTERFAEKIRRSSKTDLERLGVNTVHEVHDNFADTFCENPDLVFLEKTDDVFLPFGRQKFRGMLSAWFSAVEYVYSVVLEGSSRIDWAQLYEGTVRGNAEITSG